MIFPGFSPDALLFLRSLKRNNRREWFQPRKEKYQALIREPMLELVSGLNEAFARFAPAYIRPPQKAALRIYRDARFSQDKTPYKTHVAAIFPRNTADGMRGACLYLHFTDKELIVRAGAYWPERDELLAYRTLLLHHHQEFKKILRNTGLRRTLGGLQGEKLTRMPKGFPADHPAEMLLRHRQWYLGDDLDINLLTTSRLLPELARRFQLMVPFVEFLNRPFMEKKPAKKPFVTF